MSVSPTYADSRTRDAVQHMLAQSLQQGIESLQSLDNRERQKDEAVDQSVSGRVEVLRHRMQRLESELKRLSHRLADLQATINSSITSTT